MLWWVLRENAVVGLRERVGVGCWDVRFRRIETDCRSNALTLGV